MTITQVQFAPTMPTRKRTAAYTRVSSGKDAMLHSLSAQVSYYSALIQSRPDWEFAGIYCDEAVTGTKDSRAEFQRLLVDCKAGKIDQIITKSISRFARNTVTLLQTVRELKLLGIDVFFQEQNIHTMSAEGEMVLAILAAHAQENSLRVSESCKWRIQKMFREGRPNIGRMLGYRLRDGKFCIIPEEAKIVRSIFAWYLAGMGKNAIARRLSEEGISSPTGGRWGETSVAGILRNEKYAGNMRLQKTYVTDHLSKQKRLNHGERPVYFVSNSHEAIIPREQFDAVQREIACRAAIHQPNPQPRQKYALTGLVRCGICGANYRRKHTAAGTKYEKIVWICPTFNTQGQNHCPSQQIPEDILLAKVAEAGGFDGLLSIEVVGAGILSFIYKGKTVDLTWQNPSRRASWTPEMKEAARQKSLANAQKRKELQL
ncbi:MAG: recombinase family protein [Oscillospiraceae bacterium]|jgi:DNA invertase Pin-like site-specific DNA recombinase|nr:recombinase family protein [Oscillospiraceae bacterium]